MDLQAQLETETRKKDFTLEKNKSELEINRFMTEYLINNVDKMTDEAKIAFIPVIINSVTDKKMLSLAEFVITNVTDSKKKERISLAFSDALNKYFPGKNMTFISSSTGKEDIFNIQKALTEAFNMYSYGNPYGWGIIPEHPNVCAPLSGEAIAIKNTTMFSDFEFQTPISDIKKDSIISLIGSEGSNVIVGKYENKEGFFKKNDFRYYRNLPWGNINKSN